MTNFDFFRRMGDVTGSLFAQNGEADTTHNEAQVATADLPLPASENSTADVPALQEKTERKKGHRANREQVRQITDSLLPEFEALMRGGTRDDMLSLIDSVIATWQIHQEFQDDGDHDLSKLTQEILANCTPFVRELANKNHLLIQDLISSGFKNVNSVVLHPNEAVQLKQTQVPIVAPAPDSSQQYGVESGLDSLFPIVHSKLKSVLEMVALSRKDSLVSVIPHSEIERFAVVIVEALESSSGEVSADSIKKVSKLFRNYRTPNNQLEVFNTGEAQIIATLICDAVTRYNLMRQFARTNGVESHTQNPSSNDPNARVAELLDDTIVPTEHAPFQPPVLWQPNSTAITQYQPTSTDLMRASSGNSTELTPSLDRAVLQQIIEIELSKENILAFINALKGKTEAEQVKIRQKFVVMIALFVQCWLNGATASNYQFIESSSLTIGEQAMEHVNRIVGRIDDNGSLGLPRPTSADEINQWRAKLADNPEPTADHGAINNLGQSDVLPIGDFVDSVVAPPAQATSTVTSERVAGVELPAKLATLIASDPELARQVDALGPTDDAEKEVVKRAIIVRMAKLIQAGSTNADFQLGDENLVTTISPDVLAFLLVAIGTLNQNRNVGLPEDITIADVNTWMQLNGVNHEIVRDEYDVLVQKIEEYILRSLCADDTQLVAFLTPLMARGDSFAKILRSMADFDKAVADKARNDYIIKLAGLCEAENRFERGNQRASQAVPLQIGELGGVAVSYLQVLVGQLNVIIRPIEINQAEVIEICKPYLSAGQEESHNGVTEAEVDTKYGELHASILVGLEPKGNEIDYINDVLARLQIREDIEDFLSAEIGQASEVARDIVLSLAILCQALYRKRINNDEIDPDTITVIQDKSYELLLKVLNDFDSKCVPGRRLPFLTQDVINEQLAVGNGQSQLELSPAIEAADLAMLRRLLAEDGMMTLPLLKDALSYVESSEFDNKVAQLHDLVRKVDALSEDEMRDYIKICKLSFRLNQSINGQELTQKKEDQISGRASQIWDIIILRTQLFSELFDQSFKSSVEVKPVELSIFQRIRNRVRTMWVGLSSKEKVTVVSNAFGAGVLAARLFLGGGGDGTEQAKMVPPTPVMVPGQAPISPLATPTATTEKAPSVTATATLTPTQQVAVNEILATATEAETTPTPSPEASVDSLISKSQMAQFLNLFTRYKNVSSVRFEPYGDDILAVKFVANVVGSNSFEKVVLHLTEPAQQAILDILNSASADQTTTPTETPTPTITATPTARATQGVVNAPPLVISAPQLGPSANRAATPESEIAVDKSGAMWNYLVAFVDTLSDAKDILTGNLNGIADALKDAIMAVYLGNGEHPPANWEERMPSEDKIKQVAQIIDTVLTKWRSGSPTPERYQELGKFEQLIVDLNNSRAMDGKNRNDLSQEEISWLKKAFDAEGFGTIDQLIGHLNQLAAETNPTTSEHATIVATGQRYATPAGDNSPEAQATAGAPVPFGVEPDPNFVQPAQPSAEDIPGVRESSVVVKPTLDLSQPIKVIQVESGVQNPTTATSSSVATTTLEASSPVTTSVTTGVTNTLTAEAQKAVEIDQGTEDRDLTQLAQSLVKALVESGGDVQALLDVLQPAKPATDTISAGSSNAVTKTITVEAGESTEVGNAEVISTSEVSGENFVNKWKKLVDSTPGVDRGLATNVLTLVGSRENFLDQMLKGAIEKVQNGNASPLRKLMAKIFQGSPTSAEINAFNSVMAFSAEHAQELQITGDSIDVDGVFGALGRVLASLSPENARDYFNFASPSAKVDMFRAFVHGWHGIKTPEWMASDTSTSTIHRALSAEALRVIADAPDGATLAVTDQLVTLLDGSGQVINSFFAPK